MSMKIYRAYKLKRADQLWPFVHSVRLQATENVKRVLRDLYKAHMDNVKTDTEWFKSTLARQVGHHEDPACAEYMARLHITHSTIRRCYRFSSTRPERSPYNFDVSIGVRHYKGGIYIVAYSDGVMRDALGFLNKDKRVRDFHYQDAADKPEDIPERQWRDRRRVWCGMDSEDLWKDVLALDICRWDMFYQLDPWCDLAKDWYDRAKGRGPYAKKTGVRAKGAS